MHSHRPIIDSFSIPIQLVTSLVFICLLLAVTPSNAAAQAVSPDETQSVTALGHSFIYQGRVTDTAGAPIEGVCSFIFELYPTLSGGSAVGSEVRSGVPVADGYFSVALDYGPDVFEGDPRFLAIQVDCDGAGYVSLSPRQPLSPTPYALYATEAGSTQALQGSPVASAVPANGDVLKWNGVQWAPAPDLTGSGGSISGVDAGVGLLGGGNTGEIPLDIDFGGSGVSEQSARADHNHDGEYAASSHLHDERYFEQSELATSGQATVHWDNLTNVPGAFGGAYTAGPGLTLNNSAFSADFGGSGSADQVAHSDHNHAGEYQDAYKRTIIVSPVGDGQDASANGAALLAAHNGIADAGSTNPYLLKIEPGIYDIGSTPLTMKLFVDIEGSGQNVTVIRGAGSDTAPGATVYTANYAEIRQLTIATEANSAVDYATGIYADFNSIQDTRITDVQVNVSNALVEIIGINSVISLAELNRVAISMNGQSTDPNISGLRVEKNIGPVHHLSVVTVGGNFNRGVLTVDAAPELHNLDIEVFSGTYPRGISAYNTDTYNNSGNTGKGPIVVDSTIYSEQTGIYVSKSSPTLRNVTIDAVTNGVDVIADATSGGSVMRIDRSTIKGGTNSIDGASGYNFEIGVSQLDGTTDVNNATFTCVGAYDGSYNSLGTSC